MSDKAEIRARLVLDDRATKAALEFKAAIEEAAKAEHKANEEGGKLNRGGGLLNTIKSGGSKAAAFAAGAGAAVGLAVAAGFSKAREEASMLAEEVAHIVVESDQQVRSLAGVLTMLDEQGAKYEDVYSVAGDLKNELEDIGIAAGVSADQVTQSFQDVYERGGKTIEQAEELTDKMVQAGRIVPGGLSAITSGFNAIELGVIRARNPLVQMISATGILHGNAKSVAAQMMKMAPADQIALAEKALSAMGTKAKAMPLSFEQVKQSLGDIKDNMMEALGTPVLASLTDALGKFQEFVVAHRDEIENALEDVGDNIASAVDFVSDVLESLEDVGLENSEDLKAIWFDIIDAWREAWVGANLKSEDVRDNMKEVLTDLIKATRVMADMVKEIADLYAKIGPLIAQGLKGTHGLESYGANMQQSQIRERLQQGAHEGGMQGIGADEMDKMRQQYIQDAALLGQDAAKANADFTAAYAEHGEVVQNVTRANIAAVTGSATDYGAAFDWAAAHHNEAAEKNIAEFVLANENIQQALLMAGPDLIKTGSKGFIDALKDVGAGDFADKLKKAWRPQMGATPNAFNVNFNGTTINIKQDFRDQDPDRVAVAFRRDMGREAVARTQSRFASPFGF